MRTTERTGREPVTRFEAVQDFYSRLVDQARRAERGEAPVPDIPEREELEYVDGWVVWNGRPVWNAATGELVDVRPRADARKWLVAESAWITILEQRAEGLREETARLLARAGAALPPRYEARIDAEQGFYSSLGEQARRAMRGQAPVPDVPLRTELEFVDGWLVWKGRPVWWSGQRQEDGARKDAEPRRDGVAAPPPPSSTRPKRRRLIPLPWRRAA